MISSRTNLHLLFKRLVDMTLSSILIVLTAPLSAIIAVSILLFSGRPVLYRQERPGLYEQNFSMLKFRTLETDDLARIGCATADAARLTPLGKVLRQYSLDELPQLINVLKGEMSFVGPRPLLCRYQPFYTSAERRRFLMRPGMTGYAQVQGRNALGWDRRLALDVWYVDNWSIALDLWILFRTLATVTTAQGTLIDQNNTLPPLDQERFNGPITTS